MQCFYGPGSQSPGFFTAKSTGILYNEASLGKILPNSAYLDLTVPKEDQGPVVQN